MRKDFFTFILGIFLFISFGIFESTAFAQTTSHTSSTQTLFEKILALPFQVQEQVVDTIKTTASTGYDALQSPVQISKDAASSITSRASSLGKQSKAGAGYVMSSTQSLIGSSVSGTASLVSGTSSAISSLISGTASAGHSLISGATSFVSDTTSSITSKTGSVLSDTASTISDTTSAISNTTSAISSTVSNSISTTASVSESSVRALSDTTNSLVDATSGFFKNSTQSLSDQIQQGVRLSASITASVFGSVTSSVKDVARGVKYMTIESYCSTISLVGFECGSSKTLATSSASTSLASTVSSHATLGQEVPSSVLNTSLVVSESDSATSAVSQSIRPTLIRSQQPITTITDLYQDISYPLFDTRAVSVPYLEGRLAIFKNQLGLTSSGVTVVRNSYSSDDRLSKQTDRIYDSMSKMRIQISEDISELDAQIQQTISAIDLTNLLDISVTGSSTLDGDIDLIGRLTLSGVSGNSGQVLVSAGVGNTPVWANVSDLPAGNASTLNSISSNQFLRSDTSDSFTSGTLTFDAGTALTVNGTTTLANLSLGGDMFTDLTGTGLVNTAGVLGVAGLTTSQFASTNISQWTNDAGYLTGLSAFTTDDVAQGSTNLYSQWSPATGGINYAGGNVGIGTSMPGVKLSILTDGVTASESAINIYHGRGNQNDELTFNFFPRGSSFPSAFSAIKAVGLTGPSSNLVFSTTGVERMTLNNSGLNVVGSITGSTVSAPVAVFNCVGCATSVPLTVLNTGSSNYVNVGTDGNIFNIRNNGSVGIGTTTPSARLSVKGAGTGTGLLAQFSDSADTPRVTVLDNGNVGVGTTTPSEKLSVDGSMFLHGELRILGGGTSNLGTLNRSNLTLQTTGQTGIDFNAFGAFVGSIKRESAALANISITSTSGIGFATNKSSQSSVYDMYIRGGSVGIGTTTPSERLTVVGNGLFTGSLTASSFSGAGTGITGLAPSNFTSANISQWTNDAGYLTGLSAFTTDDVAQGSTNLYSQWSPATGGINYAGGNVGIGIVAPTNSLETSGNVVVGTGVSNLVYIGGTARMAIGLNGGSAVLGVASNRFLNIHNQGVGTYSSAGLVFPSGSSLVGLGTATPGSKFSISGNLAVGSTYALSAAPANGAIFEGNIGIGTTNPLARLSVKGAGTGTGLLAQFSDSADTPRVTVLDNGNVGIGTTTPAGKLDIQLGTGNSYARFANSVAGTGSGGLELGGFFSQTPGNVYGIYVNNSGSLSIGNQGSNIVSINSVGSIFGPQASILSGSPLPNIPTYSFANDNDTGMYRQVDNTLHFSTGGFERMRINSSGNVGIGTASPAARLHSLSITEQLRLGYDASNYWSSTIGVTGGLTMQGVGTGGSLTLSPTAGQNVNIALSGTGDFAVNTNQLYVDTSTGNVGVGTTTLSNYKLTLAGTDQFAGSRIQRNAWTVDSTIDGAGRGVFISSGEGLGFYSGPTTHAFKIGSTGRVGISNNPNSNPNAQLEIISSDTTTRTLRIRGAASQTANLTEWVNNAGDILNVVDSSGNVGIGTASPGVLLSVAGAHVTNQGMFRLDGTSHAYATYNAAGSNDSGFFFNRSGTKYWAVYNKGSSDLFQIESQTGGSSTRFAITQTGNVGIGTTTPSERLTVAGNARFTTVTSGAYAFDLNLTADGVLTTSASDERLKRDITRLDSKDTLDRMMMLEPSSFIWKEGGTHDFGLIAQEVEIVFPELVFTNGADGFKGINYSRLPALLISAVQELSSRVDSILAWFKGGTFNIQNDVCVDDVCVTKEEFKELLRQAGGGTKSDNTSNTNTTPDTVTGAEQTTPSDQTTDTSDTETSPQDSAHPATEGGDIGATDTQTDTSTSDTPTDAGGDTSPVQDSSSTSSGQSDPAPDTQTQESSQESSSESGSSEPSV